MTIPFLYCTLCNCRLLFNTTVTTLSAQIVCFSAFLIKAMRDTDDLSPIVGHCAACLNMALTQAHMQSAASGNSAELKKNWIFCFSRICSCFDSFDKIGAEKSPDFSWSPTFACYLVIQFWISCLVSFACSFLKLKLEVSLLVVMGMLAIRNRKWIRPQKNSWFSVNGNIGFFNFIFWVHFSCNFLGIFYFCE